MFLLPLGLSRKLPRFPVATVTIVSAVSLYSFTQFKKVDSVKTDMPGFQAVAVEFFYDFCKVRGLMPETCGGVVTKLIKQGTKGRKPAISQEEKEHLEQHLAQDLALNKEKTIEALKQRFANGKPSVSGVFSAVGQELAKIQTLTDAFTAVVKDPVKVTDPRIIALPSFQRLKGLIAGVKEAAAATVRKKGLDNTVLNNFRHGGLLHLFGNMLMLLIAGAFVEMRMGAVPLALAFVVSSHIGLLVQKIATPETVFVIGSSAGVMGLMGVFAGLFYKQRMRVWISYMLIVNRVIYMPTLWVVGILFLVKDLSGALDGGGNVGHVAHIMGLAVGAGIGFAWSHYYPLPEDMIYPDEAEIFESRPSLKQMEQVLTWNPDNLRAMTAGIQASLAVNSVQVNPFVKQHLAGATAILMRRKRGKEAMKLVGSVPNTTPLIEVLPRLSVRNGMLLARFCLKNVDWGLALRLYDLTLAKRPGQKMLASIDTSLQGLMPHLEASEKDLRVKLELLYLKPQLKSLVDRYVTQTPQRIMA